MTSSSAQLHLTWGQVYMGEGPVGLGNKCPQFLHFSCPLPPSSASANYSHRLVQGSDRLTKAQLWLCQVSVCGKGHRQSTSVNSSCSYLPTWLEDLLFNIQARVPITSSDTFCPLCQTLYKGMRVLVLTYPGSQSSAVHSSARVKRGETQRAM